MSGHSKWSTIKRQKGANDKARGKLFSKLARGIAIAIKSGGSASPEQNYSLRMAIEAAKAENMPKDTIDRAITKASETGHLEEVTYEGFAAGGIQLIIEAATDNRNRTAQVVKSLLEKSGGNLGGPGAVSFNFEPKGVLTIAKEDDYESQALALIDLGVEDIEEDGKILEIYVPRNELFEVKQKLESAGIEVKSAELTQKPKMVMKLTDQKQIDGVSSLLEKFDDEEDIQKVYTNATFDD